VDIGHWGRGFGDVAFARHSRESGNPVTLFLGYEAAATAKSLDSRFRGNDELKATAKAKRRL
jgi:hypothetical protein